MPRRVIILSIFVVVAHFGWIAEIIAVSLRPAVTEDCSQVGLSLTLRKPTFFAPPCRKVRELWNRHNRCRAGARKRRSMALERWFRDKYKK
jgi:hypothetical protein